MQPLGWGLKKFSPLQVILWMQSYHEKEIIMWQPHNRLSLLQSTSTQSSSYWHLYHKLLHCSALFHIAQIAPVQHCPQRDFALFTPELSPNPHCPRSSCRTLSTNPLERGSLQNSAQAHAQAQAQAHIAQTALVHHSPQNRSSRREFHPPGSGRVTKLFPGNFGRFLYQHQFPATLVIWWVALPLSISAILLNKDFSGVSCGI